MNFARLREEAAQGSTWLSWVISESWISIERASITIESLCRHGFTTSLLGL